jgi:hypothetical protein
MGIVAATLHHSGRTKSAIRPSPTKNIQNILRSTTFILNPGAKHRGLVRPSPFASCSLAGALAARAGLSRLLAAVMTAMAKNEGGSGAEAAADALPSVVAAAIQ